MARLFGFLVALICVSFFADFAHAQLPAKPSTGNSLQTEPIGADAEETKILKAITEPPPAKAGGFNKLT